MKLLTLPLYLHHGKSPEKCSSKDDNNKASINGLVVIEVRVVSNTVTDHCLITHHYCCVLKHENGKFMNSYLLGNNQEWKAIEDENRSTERKSICVMEEQGYNMLV